MKRGGCDFCREAATHVGKDKKGMETYACDICSDFYLHSDVELIPKAKTPCAPAPDPEPY